MAEDPLLTLSVGDAREYSAALQLAMLQSHERCHSYASDTLRHFGHFVSHQLPFIMAEYGSIEVLCADVRERHEVRLSNVTALRPVVESSDPSTRFMQVASSEPLTPTEARNRGLTYSSNVYVDATHTVWTWDAPTTEGEVPTERLLQAPLSYREIKLLELPVMLRSGLCHTSVDAREECTLDAGGYFIVRGSAKMIQPQKTQRINVFIARCAPRGSGVVGEIRSLRADEKFRSTSTLHLRLEGASLKVDVPFLQPGLPLVAAFRLLGFGPEDVPAFVGAGAAEDAGAAEARGALLRAVLAHPLATAPLEACVSAAGAAMARGGAGADKVGRLVSQQMAGECLPHVGYDDAPHTRFKKALCLGVYVRRMLDVALGLGQADDRDFEGYKAVEMASTLLAKLFRQLANLNLKALRKSIFQRASKRKHVDVAALMTHSDAFSRCVHTAFNEGKMTVQKDAPNAGAPIIQAVSQVNPLSLQSQLLRLCIPLPKDGKYTLMRGVDPTHMFGVCPADTPESERAGLLLTRACLATVRVGVELLFVAAAVARLPQYAAARGLGADGGLFVPLSPAALAVRGARLVFVNAEPVGVTTDEAAFVAVAREARRDHALPDEVSIVRAAHGVCVFSDNGVITFPLLFLGRAHLLPAALAAAQEGGEELWSAMVRLGILEYVDAWETLEYRVAFKVEEVRACEARRAAASAAGEAPEMAFTHLAPHPTAMLGASAGTVPFANHDQAPRISYSCLKFDEPVLMADGSWKPIADVRASARAAPRATPSPARPRRAPPPSPAPRPARRPRRPRAARGRPRARRRAARWRGRRTWAGASGRGRSGRSRGSTAGVRRRCAPPRTRSRGTAPPGGLATAGGAGARPPRAAPRAPGTTRPRHARGPARSTPSRPRPAQGGGARTAPGAGWSGRRCPRPWACRGRRRGARGGVARAPPTTPRAPPPSTPAPAARARTPSRGRTRSPSRRAPPPPTPRAAAAGRPPTPARRTATAAASWGARAGGAAAAAGRPTARQRGSRRRP